MTKGRFIRIRCLALGSAVLLLGGGGSLACGLQLRARALSTLEDAVVQLSAALGVIAAAGLTLTVLAGVLDAWRGRPAGRPGGLRRWSSAACGVGVGAALLLGPVTAQADDRTAEHLETLSGLPLPEQPVDSPPGNEPRSTASGRPRLAPPAPPPTPSAAPPAHPSPSAPPSSPARATPVDPDPTVPPPEPPVATPAPQPTPQLSAAVVVRSGDTLWDLAAAELGGHASNARIATRWQQWYAANRGVIGPDPDLLHPGTRLHRPAS